MKIGTLFGVDINVSIILVVLVVLAVILGRGAEVAMIFFVFMAHETAHVLVAKALKMKVGEIELLPFGGAVRIENVFELNPINEIYIALAGPAANILLLLGSSALQNMGLIASRGNVIFTRVNLGLAGFNLLPALPLDGGRVLRAILAREIGLRKATKVAAYGGFILALFLIMTGLYAFYLRVYNPSFFVLAGFIAYSAVKENRTAPYTSIRGVTFKKDILSKEGLLYTRELIVLYDIPLKEVMKRFAPHRYHFIKVVDHSLRVWGYLDETEILNGMVDYGADFKVGRLL
ncbi:MAG: hypothetical protein GX352_08990 [Clostridiales bacterium]|nr:hypothetical protein [Clostridiales bacterium]